MENRRTELGKKDEERGNGESEKGKDKGGEGKREGTKKECWSVENVVKKERVRGRNCEGRRTGVEERKANISEK